MWLACRFWPVRDYSWGRCETLSSVNSDIFALKQQLFEEGFADLKQATEERYYRYPNAAPDLYVLTNMTCILVQ